MFDGIVLDALASRTINVTQNLSLTASFKAVSSGGNTEPGGEDDDDNPAINLIFKEDKKAALPKKRLVEEIEVITN